MEKLEQDLLDRLNALAVFLDDQKIWFERDHKLQYETYFKTGGLAKVFICPMNMEAFVSAVKYCRSSRLEYKIIGLTSNVFFLTEVDYTVVISTKMLNRVDVADGKVDVECGYSLGEFVRVMLLQHSTGYEALEGSPGSIGGAVVMNAGAYDATISDHLVEVRFLDENSHIQVLGKDTCSFGFRSSRFRGSNDVILSVRFSVVKGNVQNISRKIEKFHIARHCYQEFSFPNLGSLFSLKRNIYYSVFKEKSKSRLAVYLALYAILYNRVGKFLRRKRPHQVIFNKLLTGYLKTDFYAPSQKSMNILSNNGLNSTRDMIRFIKVAQDALGSDAHIENEIVTSGIFSVKEDFKDTFEIVRRMGLE